MVKKLSFDQWMREYHEMTERELTEENIMKWFSVGYEEALGMVQNYHDEYGDYLEERGIWKNEKTRRNNN